MVRFVNAKLNLGLNIIRKREDGYHELETLFYPVGLFNGTPENPQPFSDILEIHLLDDAREDEFYFTGNTIDCPLEKNLVVKACREFNRALALTGKNVKPIFIQLDKHIPDGAGLGGGSADASFTLSMLNSLYHNPFSSEELISMAARLGADCPFFILNSPVLARGIGEIMQPFPLDLHDFWCVIVKPDIYISTKEAFSGITPNEPETKIEEILSKPVDCWETEGLKNDFERHIFRLHPRLEEIKRGLKNNGALYAAMSGSGSSIFGIFPDFSQAEKTATSLATPYQKTFLSKL